MSATTPAPTSPRSATAAPWPSQTKIAWCILAAFLFGLCFAVFTWIVRSDATDALDFATTVRLQNHTPVRLDPMFSFFSFIAMFQTMIVVLVAALLLARKWVGLIVSLGLFFFAHVTEIIGKGFLDHPPPPFMFYRNPTKFIFPEMHTFNDSSYPSGHSMRMIFVAMVLAFLIWKSKKMPSWLKFILLAGIIGVVSITLVSRVSLGEHWTTDVIGGVFLGLSFGSMALLFL
jgi:membrane-associated phospholipid phosphatase